MASHRRRRSCSLDGIRVNASSRRCPRGSQRDRAVACGGRRDSTTCRPSLPLWRVERQRRGVGVGTNCVTKSVTDFRREHAVARLLVGRRLRGVVPVLQVSDDTIWEQRLDTTTRQFDATSRRALGDILAGLVALRRLGVAHLDVKTANIGWDAVREQWCIFDFDKSGIYDTRTATRWLSAPSSASLVRARRLLTHPASSRLSKLDLAIFEHRFNWRESV